MSVTSPTESRRWMLVGWLTIFLVGTDLFVVSPFLPVIARDMQADPATLTWMVSLFSATYAIACPLQGRLAERLGASNVLLVGVATLAVGNLFTALAPGLPSLLASRILAGIGAASTSPMLYSLAAQFAGPNRRAADLALINSGLLIALALGAPAGLVMGGLSDWRLVFLGLSVVFAIMLPINWHIWRDASRIKGGTAAVERATATTEPLSAALPYLLAMVCWSTSVYLTYTLLGTALAADYELGVPRIAACLTAFGVGAAIGSVFIGRMADRIGPARMATLCFAAMAVAEIATSLVYRLGYPIALGTMLFVLALSAYGFFPALQSCAAQRFSARRPTVLGLISSSLYVGMTLGAALGGHLFHPIGMANVIAVALLPCLLGAWITHRLGPRPTSALTTS
ncbi:MAG: MFS transporter [Burkholderiaceae bacterium]